MASWGFRNSQFGLSALRLRIGYVSNGEVGPPIWPYDPGRIGLFSYPSCATVLLFFCSKRKKRKYIYTRDSISKLSPVFLPKSGKTMLEHGIRPQPQGHKKQVGVVTDLDRLVESSKNFMA
jgi:hypothetical protein